MKIFYKRGSFKTNRILNRLKLLGIIAVGAVITSGLAGCATLVNNTIDENTTVFLPDGAVQWAVTIERGVESKNHEAESAASLNALKPGSIMDDLATELETANELIRGETKTVSTGSKKTGQGQEAGKALFGESAKKEDTPEAIAYRKQAREYISNVALSSQEELEAQGKKVYPFDLVDKSNVCKRMEARLRELPPGTRMVYGGAQIEKHQQLGLGYLDEDGAFVYLLVED